MGQVTLILEAVAQGDPNASEELLPIVYEELRKLARARMGAEWAASTLQPTALVHEAWLRLLGTDQRAWQNRAHFFAAAAEAMRRILIERARRKRALKRGADAPVLDLDRVDVATEADADSLLMVNDAIAKLAKQDPQAAEVVKLRFFIGMSYTEAAEVLGVSERSAKRFWTFARAWLYRELRSALRPAGKPADRKPPPG